MRTISLIVPCFNSEKYIERCLQSILSQTRKDAQIIIVNDCSTDSTLKIIEKYEKFFIKEKFDFLIINKNVNEGQAAAFNDALPYVDSKYFMWLDSDDYLLETCFEDKIAFMDSHPSLDLFICEGILTNIDAGTRLPLLRKRKDKDYFMDVLEQRDVIWIPGSICVKTSFLFERIPTKKIFPSKEGQNIQLMLPILYNSNYLYLDKPLYVAVEHFDSHSRQSRNYEEQIKRIDNICLCKKETILSMDCISYKKKKLFIKNSEKFAIRNKAFTSYCLSEFKCARHFYIRSFPLDIHELIRLLICLPPFYSLKRKLPNKIKSLKKLLFKK